ncbi:HNH endonuclease [Gordonia phage WilliamBoone]|nr:HNH endonuclease [Gordonia phage WilliamBoone]
MSSMFERERHLWLTWIHMRERCNDPNHPGFEWYGGRGIQVEEPWNSDRHPFYEWARANGYERGLELDRIDNNGNYSASNCRWVTRAQNMRNRSNNLHITIDGETKVKQDWMDDPRVTIGYGTYYKRKARGWSEKDALFTPPDPRYQRPRKFAPALQSAK